MSLSRFIRNIYIMIQLMIHIINISYIFRKIDQASLIYSKVLMFDDQYNYLD
jgi:hypothetical protein